jgi:hypothetical protein
MHMFNRPRNLPGLSDRCRRDSALPCRPIRQFLADDRVIRPTGVAHRVRHAGDSRTIVARLAGAEEIPCLFAAIASSRSGDVITIDLLYSVFGHSQSMLH